MRRDEQGYFHFVDRIGDTFRWKGENVATTEVNDAISAIAPAFSMPRPTGSAVPGADGRAGMAAWSWTKGFDFEDLRGASGAAASGLCASGLRQASAARSMPPRPSSRRSSELIREGFDPSVVGDPLFSARSGDSAT